MQQQGTGEYVSHIFAIGETKWEVVISSNGTTSVNKKWPCFAAGQEYKSALEAANAYSSLEIQGQIWNAFSKAIKAFVI